VSSVVKKSRRLASDCSPGLRRIYPLGRSVVLSLTLRDYSKVFVPRKRLLVAQWASEDSMIRLKVNGVERSYSGDPQMPLLWYLRDVLGLTGTKYGCGIALCGACTVHRDGKTIRSCVTRMSALAGASITTIEHLSAAGLHPLQKAWMEHNVPQCGYCQSGQIMQAVALLEKTPHPTEQQIEEAMSGNICRCGTYNRIRAAIKAAAGERA
jgi:isoquinoline 1-oxidoreductase alpha subunit